MKRIHRIKQLVSIVAALAYTPLAAQDQLAYVVNVADNTVVPIAIPSNTVGDTIMVGNFPQCIAITPDGTMAYVTNLNDNTVTPIDLSNQTPGTDIMGFTDPQAIAITPDGTFAYVVSQDAGIVIPLNLSTQALGTPIQVASAGDTLFNIAVTPDGTVAYITDYTASTIIPITIATNTAGTAIPVEGGPQGIAITPDGLFAYVTSLGGSLSVVNLTTGIAETPITTGNLSNAIAITPDGTFAYFTDSTNNVVRSLNLATNALGAQLSIDSSPANIAITPDGAFAYITCEGGDTVNSLNLANYTIESSFGVGNAPYGIAMAPGPTAPPTNVVGTLVPGSAGFELTITWTASSSTTVTSYNVYSEGILVASVPASGTLKYQTHVDSVAAAQLFSVAAVAVSGESIHSLVSITTVPIAPPIDVDGVVTSNIFINRTEQVLTITWTASTDTDVVSYNVYNNGELVTVVSALKAQFLVSSSTEAEKYSVASVTLTGTVSAAVSVQLSL